MTRRTKNKTENFTPIKGYTKNWCNMISEIIGNLDHQCITRHRKIDYRDTLFATLLLTENRSCNRSVIKTFKFELNKEFTTKALEYRRKTISYTYFEEFYKKMLNHHQQEQVNNNFKLIAIDGTYIGLSKKLKENGFQTTSNDTYVSALVGGVYDVSNDIPLNLELSKKRNERMCFINQLNYVKENDILIFDRGYYGHAFTNILNQRNLNYVFRLKSPFEKYFDDKEDDIILEFKQHNIELRCIKYKINENTYYLGTSLFDHQREDIIRMYNYRWRIEEHFKIMKNYCKLDNILTKNENLVKQEIYAHLIVAIIKKTLELKFLQLQNYKIPDNRKINNKNAMELMYKKILLFMLYRPKGYLRLLCEIMKDIVEETILIRLDRSYSRTAIRPNSRYYRR